MPELQDSPAEALPEVGRLIEEILEDRGYEAGSDPEIERELELGRDVLAKLDAGDEVEVGDVGAAVHAYRSVYEELIAEHRAP
jgi:hypothetical protein